MAFFRGKVVVDPDAPEFPHCRTANAFTHNHGDTDKHRHLVGGQSRYLSTLSWGVIKGDHIHEEA